MYTSYIELYLYSLVSVHDGDAGGGAAPAGRVRGERRVRDADEREVHGQLPPRARHRPVAEPESREHLVADAHAAPGAAPARDEVGQPRGTTRLCSQTRIRVTV